MQKSRFFIITMMVLGFYNHLQSQQLTDVQKIGASLLVGCASGYLVKQTGKVAATLGGAAVGTGVTFLAKDLISQSEVGKELSLIATWATAVGLGLLSGYGTTQIVEATGNVAGVVSGSTAAVLTYLALDDFETQNPQ